MDIAKLNKLADEIEALAGTKQLESQNLPTNDPRQQELKVQFLLLMRWAKTIREAIQP